MPITKVTAMTMTMILKMTVMMKMTLKKITKSRERQGNPIIVSPIYIQSTLPHSEVQSSLRSEFTLVGEYSDETADYYYGVGGDDNIYYGK